MLHYEIASVYNCLFYNCYFTKPLVKQSGFQKFCYNQKSVIVSCLQNLYILLPVSLHIFLKSIPYRPRHISMKICKILKLRLNYLTCRHYFYNLTKKNPGAVPGIFSVYCMHDNNKSSNSCLLRNCYFGKNTEQSRFYFLFHFYIKVKEDLC